MKIQFSDLPATINIREPDFKASSFKYIIFIERKKCIQYGCKKMQNLNTTVIYNACAWERQE